MFGRVRNYSCIKGLAKKWKSVIKVRCIFPDRTITKVESSPVHKVIQRPACPIIETHGHLKQLIKGPFS